MSAANLALLVGAFQNLPPEHIADAGGTTRVLQQLGGSFGTAVLAAVLAHGDGATAFPPAFLWSTAFTVVAAFVGLCLPIRVASAEARP